MHFIQAFVGYTIYCAVADVQDYKAECNRAASLLHRLETIVPGCPRVYHFVPTFSS